MELVDQKLGRLICATFPVESVFSLSLNWLSVLCVESSQPYSG